MPAKSIDALAQLWRNAGLPAASLSRLRLTGSEPLLPSTFAVGTSAQATVAASALAAAEIWRVRTGRIQEVTVDMRHALIESRSERYLRVEGRPEPAPWDPLTGAYRCGDGRWVRIHAGFPHHRAAAAKWLARGDAVLTAALEQALAGSARFGDGSRQREDDRAIVERALERYTAQAFEDEAAEAGAVAGMMRSFAEWDTHPQGQAVEELPLVAIEKIGEAPAEALPAAARPLAGVRVLDLTRVIAGPVCGRTLAAHGADVLNVSARHLPNMGPLVIDTGRGKLATQLDLRDAHDRAKLENLLRDSTIFVQSYRPDALEQLGFGALAAARIRPGLVYVSLSAYGVKGPWARRRGFDSVVQTVSGFNFAEGEARGSFEPVPLPNQALDHGAGYLMAFGCLAALHRRITEGGSWLVRISLAGTGRWLRGLGRVQNGLACRDLGMDQVRDLLEETSSGFGRLTAVRHSPQMSETPPRWTRPAVPLNTHPPCWPE
jgi:crotonobetainyl-CoA:carnitine CoA-transferase CaiB-like acyl-CoA transferase